MGITCDLEGKGSGGANVNHDLISFKTLKPFESSDGGLILAVVNQCANADFYVCCYITLESVEGVGAVGWGCDHCLSPLSWIIGGSRWRVGGMDGRSLHLGPNRREIMSYERRLLLIM